jgi:hypothetical protein
MDFSSYWAFYQRYKSKSGQLVLILAALAVGWQIGRTTSPYYAAQPIVFEDTACDRSGGSTQELTELKNEGVAQRDQTSKAQLSKQKDNTSAVSPEAAVAGAAEDSNNTAKTTGKFVGSVNSNLFHDPSCAASKRIKETNQIWFDSTEDAAQAGYSPSKCTQKLLGL